MPTNDDSERFYDVPGLADYSGLSESWIRRHIADKANPLPSHCVRAPGKQRGRVLVSKLEFDRWVKAFPPASGDAAAAAPVDTDWIRRALK